ncbi:LPS-assembly lipoprotein LptE [Candidimonas nitroreducens]|uniref:LPS-assembly lipoprotein LptE n=1 Tax=Candidimonas nitroreducens TaxID=683354 RepID=A0A225MCY6_9BURK|nr:LPS assembly lipoprotein LptE [Candidimonas nitroreducens]OWT57421.1 hypothetical protein CEY11_15985 [Candidimonas nitroreducens]
MRKARAAIAAAYFPAARLWARGLACAALCALLTACGFRLRGPVPLPFDTVYTNITENSDFGARLRRALRASSPNLRFVDQIGDAQVRLIQIANNQSLRELSLNTQGLVEEYELNLSFVFELMDAKGHVLLPPTTLTSSQDLPYDPNQVQAKQGEIATLFLEMQKSLVDRIVRRLSSPDVIEAARKAQQEPPAEDSQAAPGGAEIAPAPVPWVTPRVEPSMGM